MSQNSVDDSVVDEFFNLNCTVICADCISLRQVINSQNILRNEKDWMIAKLTEELATANFKLQSINSNS